MRYRRHVFVCTNTRPVGGKPSCGARGGVEIAAALQRAVATAPGLVGAVAVTPCGCLGPCFDGPTAIVYPEGEWMAGIAEGDVPEIAAWLDGGELPARLRYEWSEEEDGSGNPD
jgi:(2Fe-2S) ferredoxin